MIIPNNIKELMQKLIDNNFEAYIIGGAVRDFLLGIVPHDYDIFTNATGEQILEVFPHGNIIGNDERQKKILTVIVDGVESSQYRRNGERTETGNNLKDHINTCDFTCNAIACDINGELIDYVNGIEDIKNGTLRFVGNPIERINEDKLRILRGIRFWDKFRTFKHIDETLQNIDLLDTLPKERIREEFIKILSTKTGLENIWRDRIIYKIMPHLQGLEAIKGGDYHNENVKEHSINAFNNALNITDDWRIWLAALFHDIGKKETFSEEVEGEVHFYEHENIGENIVKEWMEEYKFKKEDIKFVSKLVRLHMYSYKDKPSKKSYIRFFNKLEAAKISIEDYIMLIYCDHQGNMAKPRIKFGDFIKNNWLHKRYYEIKFSEEPMAVKDLKISGKDVMEIFEIKKGGPIIGKILNSIFNSVMNGDLKNNKAELRNFLKSIKQSLLDESISNLAKAFPDINIKLEPGKYVYTWIPEKKEE